MGYSSSDGEGGAHLDTVLEGVAPTIEEGGVRGIGEDSRDGDKRKRSYGALRCD